VSNDNKGKAVVYDSYHAVIQTRFLTESSFILRFTREDIHFRAGQHIIVGLKGEMDQREYSIYSSEEDDFLEILVKEVKDGNISSKLKHCNKGDVLQVNGPFGSFGIEAYNRNSRKHIFIATGTGISPFHSMVRSFPGINYTLIHGVRQSSEAYERDEYDPARYILCTSKEKSNGRKGRVTGFLSKFRVTDDMLFYLCGNGNMIYEVYHILRDKGVPDESIISEVYF
jgi:ferredoxin-NADP reductase